MKSLYKQLLEVNVTHDYYDSGNCSDFLFEPTRACIKLLKRNFLHFIQTQYGFKLIYQPQLGDDKKPVEPYTPFMPTDSNLALDFKVFLKNKQFGNFTDLPVMQLSGVRDILFFNNNLIADKGVLSSEAIKLRPEAFSISFKSITSGLAAMEIESSAGDKVYGEMLASTSEYTNPATGKLTYVFQNSFDVSHLEPDVYTLKITTEGIAEKFYPNSSLIKDNIFGIVRIIGDSFDFEDGTSYSIAFSRKTVQWKYYVVCKNSYSKLKILENSETPQIFFDEVKPAPGSNTKLFKSVTSTKADQQLPFTESPKKGLQLLNDTTVLVENLPNPSINDINGEKYIYI